MEVSYTTALKVLGAYDHLSVNPAVADWTNTLNGRINAINGRIQAVLGNVNTVNNEIQQIVQLPIIQNTQATIQANVLAMEAAAAVISITKLAKPEPFSGEKGTILIDDWINKVKIYCMNETNDTRKIALALSLLQEKTEEYCREYSRKVANSNPTIGMFEAFCDYM